MIELPGTIDAETLLAVDVGSVHTRASLFDVVDNQYRLVATGRSLSTATTPLLDIGEGVRMALDQVQTVTGRRLLDEQDSLIMPSTSEGAGVDVGEGGLRVFPIPDRGGFSQQVRPWD